jgi:serine/threonine protein kinase
MWLVMEFCNGGSLAELIKAFNSNKFSIPVPVIKSLMRKITDAFATLLSQHLLQTDLAPGNIMLHYPPALFGSDANL